MASARSLAVVIALCVVAHGCGESESPSPSRPPDGAAGWHERGNDLLQAKDLAGAVDAYRKAVDLSPSSAEAHYALGRTLLELGDAEGAAAEIESALSLARPDAGWRKEAEDTLVIAYLRRSQAAR